MDFSSNFFPLFKYTGSFLISVCETLDEIHEGQLDVVIAKMREEKSKTQKPVEIFVKWLLQH